MVLDERLKTRGGTHPEVCGREGWRRNHRYLLLWFPGGAGSPGSKREAAGSQADQSGTLLKGLFCFMAGARGKAGLAIWKWPQVCLLDTALISSFILTAAAL